MVAVILVVNLQQYGQNQICHYLFLTNFDSCFYSNHLLAEENVECKEYYKILIMRCYKILIVNIVIN